MYMIRQIRYLDQPHCGTGHESLLEIPIMFIKIHHTIFMNFTCINKKDSPHQNEHSIISAPMKVDNLHLLRPFTALHNHKFSTVITHSSNDNDLAVVKCIYQEHFI